MPTPAPACRDEMPEEMGDNPDAAALQAILEDTTPEEAAEGFKVRWRLSGEQLQLRECLHLTASSAGRCAERRSGRRRGNATPPPAAMHPHLRPCTRPPGPPPPPRRTRATTR